MIFFFVQPTSQLTGGCRETDKKRDRTEKKEDEDVLIAGEERKPSHKSAMK